MHIVHVRYFFLKECYGCLVRKPNQNLNELINKDKNLSAWGISKRALLKEHSYLFELESRKSFKVNTRLVSQLELLVLMNYKKETG